ncbi:unnamed protein product [Tilletia controversa]|nr:unnamed protein product [Tilletia controversa]CAD6973210.1 unnamed protein product [Tilletia controversa]
MSQYAARRTAAASLFSGTHSTQSTSLPFLLALATTAAPRLSARAQEKQACREQGALEHSSSTLSSSSSWSDAARRAIAQWSAPSSSSAAGLALEWSGAAASSPSSSSSSSSLSSLLRDLLEPILRAVPKKKVSHSRKSMRSANKGLKDRVDIVHCPGCGRAKLHHHLCEHCYGQINRRQKAELRDQHLQGPATLPDFA